MATFEYQALTPAGRLIKGTMEAPSRDQASADLAEMKLQVSSLEQSRAARAGEHIGRTEFMLFNQQLASLTKSGIPLSRGLRELAGDVNSKKMRRIVEEVAGDLEAGTSVEEAFEKRQGIFPALYSRIMKAGVRTGRLSEMLMSLNKHLESAGRTRRIVFEAISYPAVIVALAAVIVTAIFRFLIPSFKTIYSDMGSRLPGLTKMFISAADHVYGFWLVVGVIVAVVVVIWLALSGTSKGKRWKEAFLIRLPVFGQLHHRQLLARLTDAMGLLVTAGCDMPTSLRLAADATGSDLMMAHCQAAAERVESGRPVIEAGGPGRLLPPLVLYSIQLGSQRNELQDNLYSLADMYRQQTVISQSRLQAVLMPMLLILVGGFVCLTVLAMFLPMVHLIDTVST